VGNKTTRLRNVETEIVSQEVQQVQDNLKKRARMINMAKTMANNSMYKSRTTIKIISLTIRATLPINAKNITKRFYQQMNLVLLALQKIGLVVSKNKIINQLY
jgi:hypothetical protein